MVNKLDSVIEGKDGGKKVTMFVDTGSTFSMLPQALAEKLGVIPLPKQEHNETKQEEL